LSIKSYTASNVEKTIQQSSQYVGILRIVRRFHAVNL